LPGRFLGIEPMLPATECTGKYSLWPQIAEQAFIEKKKRFNVFKKAIYTFNFKHKSL
jgi:hypothetical protein